MSRFNSSKVSLAESFHESEPGTSESLSDDENFIDEDESDEDYTITDSCSLADILAKYGFDYKSLFTMSTKKLENGALVRLNPPLIGSLFVNVPPVINFITLEEKSINFVKIKIKSKNK